jgi:hypothetical protein
MKASLFVPLGLALMAATAPQPKVQVADGDWSELPLLQSRGQDHLHPNAMQRVWELANQGKCQIPGYSLGTLDMRLSFAAQYNPDGSLAQLILPQMNCPEAEGVLAGAVLEMVQGGDYRQTGKSPTGWYRGNLMFVFEGGPHS